MRLRQSRVPTLLLLLPALQVLATSIAVADDKAVARAAVPAYPDVSAAPNPSLAPAAGSKGTKDAPFDGQDGMPHLGPYINDDPSPTKKKPAVVEELGPKKTIVGPAKPPAKEDKILDGDKSVMQDPDRKAATGNKGTEGGVSAKDKERLAHEDKTGSKLEKVPESPKEAPPLPHDQKQLQGDALGAESSTRALGAVGLEVGTAVTWSSTLVINDFTETHESSRYAT
jgi:hypothetical protein